VNLLDRFGRVIVLLLLLCSSAIAGGTTPAYQKGTITESLSPTHKFYELRDGANGYQFNDCGDFQIGQVVDYRLDNDKLYVHRDDGNEGKCTIKGRTRFEVPAAEQIPPPNYMKGTIWGYEALYRIATNSTLRAVRRTKVYELRGPDLIYEIAFCGAFQAGQFKEGQVVAYRVEGERLYIFRGNSEKDYNCQIEAKSRPGNDSASAAQPRDAAPTSVASTPSTAMFSVSSVPDGADIEVDGNFVGNTPSELEVPEGDHSISVKKTGYASWERKVKVVTGSKVHLNAELTKATQ